MGALSHMPPAGLVVILLILILFVLALGLLFWVCGRYGRLSRMVGGKPVRDDPFLRTVVNDFAEAYKKHGAEANTPAIIQNAVNTKLPLPLFCERFLNNAVSLIVTLGLFGTFLGLSLSVSSLTELISYSNTSEWLSVLDSVGGGLMSALSGMGVAFYTSLVGVACSILLTVLRSIFNPANRREKLETQLELWLDHSVAPSLPAPPAKDDASLVQALIGTLKATADSMESSLKTATDDLRTTLEAGKAPLTAFHQTVTAFNNGVRDFSEYNYNLRGTVERMDVSVRDLVSAMREAARDIERSAKA